jgi:Flp pilus assembly protein TadB
VTVAIALFAATAIIIAVLLLRRRSSRRQRALSQVLDAADALEERLRTARAEIEAIAGSEDNPVRDALQEMLRQRLWLQQHGQQASVAQLVQVRDSIDAGRQRIDQQLLQIERARAPSVH